LRAGGKTEAVPVTAPEPASPAAQPAAIATDPRLASVEEARTNAQSDAVRAALDEHEKTVRKTIANEEKAKKQAADVDALEAAAKATQDPALRTTLQARADKLRGEKIPVGDAKELTSVPVPAPEKLGKIPAGKVIEGQPESPAAKAETVPVGEATEIEPEMLEPSAPEEPVPTGEATELSSNVPQAEADAYAHRALFDEAARRGIEVRGRRPSEVRSAFEADWRREHGLGAQDAERAKNTATALNIDEKAVETAARQHEKSPRSFDRAVQDIIDRGPSNATETQQAATRSQSNPSNAAGSQAGSGAGRGGNANDSAGGASGSQSNPNTGSTTSAVEASTKQPGVNRNGAPRANSESNQPRGQTETRGVDKKGGEYSLTVKPESFGADKNSKSVLVEARDPKTGERRGFVDFEIRADGVLIAGNVKVAPEFRGRDIAPMMYKAARDAGYDIAPGGVQTDRGNKLVDKLVKQGVINKEAQGPRFKAGDLDLAPIEGEKIPGEKASRPEPKGFEKGATPKKGT
jgi:hypothetical protein